MAGQDAPGTRTAAQRNSVMVNFLKRFWRKQRAWRRVSKAWRVWAYLIEKAADAPPSETQPYLIAALFMGGVVGELLADYEAI